VADGVAGDVAEGVAEGATAGDGSVGFVDLQVGDRRERIEHRWLGRPRPGAPLAVFLHEGLGSVSMWRDFPARVCAAADCRGLVWSRAGYGFSAPPARGAPWQPDYMHREALEVLPALLAAMAPDPDGPLVLVGHSDGGSIALLFAARFPGRVSALAVLAPHIFVEPLSVTSIAAAGTAWETTDLPRRLARHHADADGVFRRWNAIWLAPAFRHWSIEEELPAIRCPVLAIQGLDDEYGTLAQIHGIARHVPDSRLLELADCGHSPQRDRPDETIAAIAALIRGIRASGDGPDLPGAAAHS
jgi:pimeloyl-ACP methyl ester carboxylesterase